jgi:type IV pilus assembly protein PilE
MKPNPSGFSLIELLIALTLTGLLISLTLPSYTTHITQQKRLIAQTTLLDLAGEMEIYFLQHNTYEGANLASLRHSQSLNNPDYQFTTPTLTPTYFELAAAPINQQAKRDSVCGTLVVDSRSLRHASLDPDLKACW